MFERDKMSFKIPMSIGFEVETQYMCPILLNDTMIKSIDPDRLVSYQIYSNEKEEFIIYGDAFTEDTDFSTEANRLKFASIEVKPHYERQNLFLELRRYPNILRNMEFVNTFPKDQQVSKLWNHIRFYLKKCVQNVETFLENPLKKYNVKTESYPYPFLYKYGPRENPESLVTYNLERLRSMTLDRLRDTKEKVVEMKDVISRKVMKEEVEKIEKTIELVSELRYYKNRKSLQLGIMSRLPIPEIKKKARVVCQCTFGFPIIYSIDVMTQCYEMVKKFGVSFQLLDDFQAVLDVVPMLESKLDASNPRYPLLLNYLFLFYYSVTTRKKRKDISLFSIRANFQDLMYLLSHGEKCTLYSIMDRSQFKSLFADIHFKKPYLLFPESDIRQCNHYISHILDPELEKKRFTRVDENYRPSLEMTTKIFIEFRMLHFVIAKSIGKVDVTLEDIKLFL
jgi:hypothetical protein